MRRFLAALCVVFGLAALERPALAEWCGNTRLECFASPAPASARQHSRQVRRARPHQARAAVVLVASWYDADTETASGEAFDAEAATCAHNAAPFGAWLRITARATGRSTICRVNDRGPFKRGRAVDVTRAGARDLGILETGTAAVAIARIPAPAAPIAAIPLPPARPAEPAELAIASASPDLAAIAANEGHDDPLSRARAYLVLTSTPGGTMSLLGADWAIGQLHPVFVTRAAAAIAEARASGLPRAGVFSSYRPPGLGVGAFADKFNSLHAYGLAADFTGIGSAGSAAAVQWYRIATRHGLYNPYGPRSRAEFNHYQATRITIVLPGSPLRRAVTRQGPVDVARMWQLGAALIDAGPVRRAVVVRLARSPRRHDGRLAAHDPDRTAWR